MRTADFDYELPRELIATRPADRRDLSRLMVLERQSGTIEHKIFADIASNLRPGDLLVMNDSRVMKARLRGTRRTTGAAVETLLLEQVANTSGEGGDTWRGMCRPAKKYRMGEWIDFAGGELTAQVTAEEADGERVLRFDVADVLPVLDRVGEIPLPPYIVQRRRELGGLGEEPDDAVRYQTVYSDSAGSIAAPTAGLHFTTELLEELRGAGVKDARVTLHVGAGTFKPVEVEDPAAHPIHAETCQVPAATAQAIMHTKAQGGRVIAVGTTTVRTLESAWDAEAGEFRSGQFSTRLLIVPGYEFQLVDGMVTNFHLPMSSLLMMVSAFAGHQRIMDAYAEAIRRGYRFYSYGDAMLLV